MSKTRYSRPLHNTVDKVLANDDRWLDESVASRDIVDIAYMIESWGMAAFDDGIAIARIAYGAGVDCSVRASAQKLLEKRLYLKKCVASLGIKDVKTLTSGLNRIVARDR